jgi:hypothetical protein
VDTALLAELRDETLEFGGSVPVNEQVRGQRDIIAEGFGAHASQDEVVAAAVSHDLSTERLLGLRTASQIQPMRVKLFIGVWGVIVINEPAQRPSGADHREHQHASAR